MGSMDDNMLDNDNLSGDDGSLGNRGSIGSDSDKDDGKGDSAKKSNSQSGFEGGSSDD